MATTIFNTILAGDYEQTASSSSVFTKFFSWCAAQNRNHLLWLGIILAAHGCILTPITAMVVLTTGNHFILFMLSMIAMGMSLVSNLAALPTKYTLPIFFLSLLIDLGVVIAALAI